MTPLSRRLYAIGAIVLAAVIFTALNIGVDAWFTNSRIDLTANSLYTLAPGTRNIIAKVQEPITLRFYYSKKTAADYAQVSAYATRVSDMLKEYAALSHGKIILQEVDPEPFSPAEDEASSAGLSGAPTDSGDVVYFGLVGTNSIDGKEVVPYFNPDRERYLEYDLSSLIYRLSNPKKPVLGIVTTLPLDGGAGGMAAMLQGQQQQPLVIYQQLSQTYTTDILDPNFDRIPENIDVLMIAHPGQLSAAQNYAIDQFVLRGGRALIFVDPMSEISQASGGLGGQGSGPILSSLPLLFQTWGFSFTANQVVADKTLAQRVQVSSDPRNPIASYPIWLHVTKDYFDPADQITASLQTLNLASAGALMPLKGAPTTFTPLVWSSKQASLLDAMQVRINPRPTDLMSQVHPTGVRYTLAARVTGPAKTAFPNGPPPGTPTANMPPPLKTSNGNINVVVMADTDMLDDRFWVHTDNLYGKQIASPFADNGPFVQNAVENLMGSSDLISLRTRASSDRPFIVVQELQAEAEASFKAEADALQQKMSDTQEHLRALQAGGSANGQAPTTASLTKDQQAEIEQFKRDLLQTRAQLRDVQHNLRKDIDALGSILAFINIALVPILVAVFALVLALLRRRRRARAIAH
ncbi:MAG TPA: Gldg family protein [Rhizomicrobium sp.]|jgi:ABC-type uncharacterized transport system involved in gliding motility auxiliary subunit|nr:Gldg family protein [Rhizomicrobium sp.]